MKILVPVKRVVDYKTTVRIKQDGSAVDIANVKMAMNPFDEIALEEALRIREQGIATEVIALSIGEDVCQETLRTALAMGADRAILVKSSNEIQPLAVANIIKKIVETEAIQFVLLGKQAIDSDNNQVGQMLAGLLAWPQATFASKLVFQHQRVSVTREVDGGLDVVLLTLPAVVTTDLRLNEPRYISLPNIVKSKQKPLAIIMAESLGLDLEPHIKLLRVTVPEKKRAGIKLENAAELVKRLKEAQVI